MITNLTFAYHIDGYSYCSIVVFYLRIVPSRLESDVRGSSYRIIYVISKN